MERSGDAEDVPIETFVDTFAKLSRRGRRLAIQKLVATLDSDEMDMVIEAIDTKIDDVAVQHEAKESRNHTMESESLGDHRTKKMIQEDPWIMEQPLTVKPKNEEPKPEVDQDPLQSSCSHCSVCLLYTSPSPRD